MSQISVRYARVQIETPGRVNQMESDNLGRVVVEPAAARGQTGPLVCVRTVVNDAKSGKVGRLIAEFTRENTVALVRKLVLHFNITPEELRGD